MDDNRDNPSDCVEPNSEIPLNETIQLSFGRTSKSHKRSVCKFTKNLIISTRESKARSIYTSHFNYTRKTTML